MIKINFKFQIGDKVKYKGNLNAVYTYIISSKKYSEFKTFNKIEYGLMNKDGLIVNTNCDEDVLERDI